MHSVAVPTDPKPSDAGVTGASTPPIGRYLPVPIQVHEADPDAPEVARCLIALISTRWPATPAEHVGSSAVPGLAGKGIIDLLLAVEPADISAITQALLELGFQPQVPAAFPATRPMLWGTFRHGRTTVTLVRAADLRYQGQGYTVEVSADTLDTPDPVGALAQRFVDAYTRLYGVAATNAPIEIVHWKVAGIGPVEPLDIRQAGPAPGPEAARQALKGQRPMYIPEAGGFQPGAVYDRYALRPGDTVPGPAVVEERESSLVLLPGSSARVDTHLNMVVTLTQ